jgi:hypothetical protein
VIVTLITVEWEWLEILAIFEILTFLTFFDIFEIFENFEKFDMNFLLGKTRGKTRVCYRSVTCDDSELSTLE